MSPLSPLGCSRRTLLRAGLTVAVAGAVSLPARADEAVRVRLGTLAPRGSFYHRALQEMAEKWRQAQGGGATFTIFTDGTQGGEADMVRRMRIGQLNAALITVVGLMQIERSVAALQVMPLVFRNWEELDFVRERITARFEQRMLEKGFVVLFWGDAGWVRYFSKEPAHRPEDFKSRKIFAWAGDNDQVQLMKTLGYQPVPLETADILPALQTGLINVVPSGTYYALAGQFNTIAHYMLDLRWVPIVGAAVVTRTVWDAMSPAGREQLMAAARVAGPQVRAHARKEDDEAIEAMKKRGLNVYAPSAEEEAEWRRAVEQAYPRIRGTLVPADAFDEVMVLLREYRSGR
ncbi:MAG TPA: TRAP transporter substrate-binding protein DctP [Burkholderiales bacterium]|nr:TRAP transporter substrate-binding protein DctP [Burkholderiales bacterium]